MSLFPLETKSVPPETQSEFGELPPTALPPSAGACSKIPVLTFAATFGFEGSETSIIQTEWASTTDAITQARDFTSFELHAFLRFLGGESKSRNREPARIAIACWNERVIKHADIGDKEPRAIGR